jgi:alcohol dehydrogenase class IV
MLPQYAEPGQGSRLCLHRGGGCLYSDAMRPFTIGAIPSLEFGEGVFSDFLISLAAGEKGHLVVVTGGHSFRASKRWRELKVSAGSLRRVSEFSVAGEPSPGLVDGAVAGLRADPPDLVVAIGGGSTIDAGKAIAAMVCADGSVKDYLEGVGDREPSGETIPVVAIPTTSGTGSEATKNAVISHVGANGYKKSLRHDNYVPQKVYIDPELTIGCPLEVTRYAGLDAITQLLEAYVSTDAGNVTDIYAIEGLRLAGLSFPALASGSDTIELRASMALAAYYSGIALAHAGLGIVHGLASPLGAAYPAPHGAVCGTLLAEATATVIGALEREAPLGENGVTASEGLSKYAKAGATLGGKDLGSPGANTRYLVDLLYRWVDECEVPALSAHGMRGDDISTIALKGGPKNTPASLGLSDIEAILRARL